MPNDFPSARSGVLVQQSAETVVLLDSKGGEYFALDEVGSRIWALCDGKLSRAEITQVLCTEYDVDPAIMRSDLDELLAELAEARLLIFNG
jgi:hypothetical protein